ncbi:MAG: amino acid ABC transporter permease [Alphaproteobacteria bacterium]|nr:amino acid ABC transporter permease [Alphaproteobacteria bacterium]
MKGFDAADFLANLTNLFLIQGVVVTVWLTAAAMAGGLALGLAVALLRMSSNRVCVAGARVYIWLFRGTPLLIQLVVIYTGLPQIGIKFGVVASALIALILNEAAYLSEIIRGGFLAVPVGQRDAAKALGLSPRITLWKVTLPQAARIILPPLGNSVNGLLKATSITSVISMEELMRRSEMLMQLKFDVLEVFAAAALYYLALTSLWDMVQRRLEARLARAHGAAPSGMPTLVKQPAPAE